MGQGEGGEEAGRLEVEVQESGEVGTGKSQPEALGEDQPASAAWALDDNITSRPAIHNIEPSPPMNCQWSAWTVFPPLIPIIEPSPPMNWSALTVLPIIVV